MERFIKFFVTIVFFVFLAFIFPTIYSECQNVNASLTTAPIIKVFPWILITVVILVPVYLGIRGRG